MATGMHRSPAGGAEPSGTGLRLLVVDFTPAGDGTATGELKSAIFSGLGSLPIMQVSTSCDVFEYAYPNDEPAVMRAACLEDLVAQLDWFAPTLILARPTAEKEALWLLALALRARYDIPLLVWIMDDWLSVIGEETRRAAFESSLASVFSQTGSGLSICDEMSGAFAARYSVPFTAIANGIEPDGEFARFTPRRSAPDEPFVLRYAGGLAHNMGVETLERVAQAVRRLRRDGVDICLEIKTRGFWLDQQGARFNGIDGVRASETSMARYPYLTWLSEADCNLICYNFSDASHRYVRYSLANKLPELLGVGAPVLGIGPADLPTIARLRDLGAGLSLSNPHPDAIERCLRHLVRHRTGLDAVARRGREIAESHFNLHDIRRRFVEALRRAQADHIPLGDNGMAALLAASSGFRPARLGLDLDVLARRTEVPPGAARIETPAAQRRIHRRAGDGRDDPVPPRPAAGESALMAPDLAEAQAAAARAAQTAPGAATPLADRAAGLPLSLERPADRERPWLAPKVAGAREFSLQARARAREAATANVPVPADGAAEAYSPLAGLRVEALNGARFIGGEAGGFIIERQGAPSAEHAALFLGIDGPIRGLRLEIGAIRGKAELLSGGEVLVAISRQGSYDIAFRRPRLIERIAVRCLDSMQARLTVTAFAYLPAEARAPAV